MQNGAWLSPKISLDDTQTGNRRILAKADITAGEKLLEESMEIVGLYSECHDRACHHCLEERKELKRCSGCKYAYYCSSEHQMEDWKLGHKKECTILKSMTNDGQRKPTAPLMMVLKAFVQIEIMKNSVLEKTINSFISHRKLLSQEKYEELRDNVLMILKFYDKNYSPDRVEKFISIQERILLNGVTIYSFSDPSISLAMGILKDFARTNHSCQPNCFTCFTGGKKMRIVSAGYIPAGEELTFSYVNNLDWVENRQERLRTEYFFECQCPKCIRELENKKLEGNKTRISRQELQKPLSTLEEAKAYVQSVSSRLEDLDYDWYTMVEHVEPLLIRLKEFKFLFELREKLTPKLEIWFKGARTNPVLGQSYYNLAKLANQLDDPKKTFEYSQVALSLLQPYFSGALLDDLSDMMQDSLYYLQHTHNTK